MSTTPAPSNPTATPDLEDLRATAKPTALSARLRELRCFGPDHFPLLEQAADEIERYHGGMLAALAAMPAAAQGDAKHLVDAVTAVMSKHGLIDHLTLGATERFCDELLATFTANAEQGVVLPSPITPAPQGYAWRGMNPDLSDAINKLALNDAVAYASLNAGIVQGLSQADTLAHIVLNLATSKGQLEAELYRLAALSPPGKAAL